jgi:hypothetical protein
MTNAELGLFIGGFGMGMVLTGFYLLDWHRKQMDDVFAKWNKTLADWKAADKRMNRELAKLGIRVIGSEEQEHDAVH